MFGYGAREKFYLFIIGVLVTIISLIGLAFAFNYAPGFIAKFPQDPRVYFSITTFLGIVAIAFSFSRGHYI